MMLIKEHLLKEGWKKSEYFDRLILGNEGIDWKGEIELDEDWLTVESSEGNYNGKLPTLEQWGVLKELLNIK